jgi:hypothetical protein
MPYVCSEFDFDADSDFDPKEVPTKQSSGRLIAAADFGVGQVNF